MRTLSVTWIIELPADKFAATMEASSVPSNMVPTEKLLDPFDENCDTCRWHEQRLKFPNHLQS
jgi:hypothetical protein